MSLLSLMVLLALVASNDSSVGLDPSQKDCVSEINHQEFAAAKVEDLIRSISDLKAGTGEPLKPEISLEARHALAKYFEADLRTTSRLEQFYALLYMVGQILKPSDTLVFDIQTVKKMMHSARVFQKPDLVEAMTHAEISWSERRQEAHYRVLFNAPEVSFPLNNGKGFKAFQHGFCQHVEKLILYGELNATVRRLKNGNILATYHEPVDLYGRMGSRGVVSVNVSYVTLQSVEFLNGSRLGTTRAKISRREFETTRHSWFLRWVSRLVSETSTQQIDW